MVACLKEILGSLTDLHHTVQQYMDHQVKFNSAMMVHSHLGTAGPIPAATAPDPVLAMKALETSLKTVGDGILQVDNNLSNIAGPIEGIYLDPNGPKYICSEFNTTN